MTWQGIPFKLISGEKIETVNLALQSIPKIVIDSSPDYTSPVITAVVSLIAGIIPAGIAVWTFKRNARNTKSEREAQQSFLIQERAAQQHFLKEQRAAQIASMDKDREMQSSIARQNFNMQVLSANRQEWINNLRDLIAEYMALAPQVLQSKFDFNNNKNYYSIVVKKGKGDVSHYNVEVYTKFLESASNNLSASIEAFTMAQFKFRLIVAKIKMMLSPKEGWYTKLTQEFNKIEENYNTYNEHDEDLFLLKNRNLNDSLDVILDVSQKLLKYEWERVKKGI